MQFVIATTFALSMHPSSLNASSAKYQQHNLVSDGAVSADQTDSHLVNAWGIAFNPNGPVWVVNNGTGTSTLYDGNGAPFPPPPILPQPLVVEIPASSTDASPGNPTGIVFNGSTDFVITKDTTSQASLFIFATESGVISAWAPTVDLTHALVQVDNSATGAIYKGLAIGGNGSGHFLYATDFHNNKIDVFDKNFQQVTLAGDFIEPSIPVGFAPFGIQNINGDLYVTYAKQDADKHDDVHGKGFGYVSIFDANGHFLRRFVSQKALNAPWGIALAPANFGEFGGHLLIGNFGDGTIGAYELATGKFNGRLLQANNKPLVIDGLWGLSFGNGLLSQSVDTLFFTAGPQDEQHGLYGRIDPIVERH
jgi:uncharacterized protein (TIGR03118 family)